MTVASSDLRSITCRSGAAEPAGAAVSTSTAPLVDQVPESTRHELTENESVASGTRSVTNGSLLVLASHRRWRCDSKELCHELVDAWSQHGQRDGLTRGSRPPVRAPPAMKNKLFPCPEDVFDQTENRRQRSRRFDSKRLLLARPGSAPRPWRRGRSGARAQTAPDRPRNSSGCRPTYGRRLRSSPHTQRPFAPVSDRSSQSD